MALKQAERNLQLKTPLGDNELVLTAFRGQEEMSRLFSFHLEMISDNNAVTASDIVGKNVTFSVRLPDDSFRHFNGQVSRFSAGDEDHEGRRNYRAEVVPWLWFLTRTADCRIFQQQTAPQIIEQIFSDLGFSDYQLQLGGNHPQRDYCVQYRETDFNFVSRLMEEEGMFFFFKHEDGKHTMVIADRTTAYEDCPESEVDYPTDRGARAIEHHITSWEHRYEFRTGKWAQTDYNFETPSTSLMTNTDTVVDLPGNDKYEVYDYPGIYGETGDGQPLTDIRMEEAEVEHDVVQATSNCKTFTPGGKFKVRQHRASSEAGKKYVITSIEHTATESEAYETGAGQSEGYSNRFTCIPDSVTFRPERITRKPFVQGVQTAVVVGPSGEEIYPDEFGRVKVQFHWDREGKKDENSSCWTRVSQVHAGKGWGGIDIPRIGEEVIVDFLEGDPDRPIIIGRVYHAENMPPYSLPDNKTQSGMKSRSSKGGNEENFNEIRFEDLKGEEQVFIHAEKNQDIEVENDETHWVGRDRSKTIDRDEITQVKRDRTESVGRNESISIGNNREETVGKNEDVSISENRSISVGKDETHTVSGNRSKTVSKDENTTVQGNRTEDVSKNEEVRIAGGREHSITKDDKLSVGKKLFISAGDEITLVTGSASLVMKKNGDIEIKGNNFKVQASGKIQMKASSNVSIKGSKIAQN